ncbi:HD domain [Carpediemonas membranifera]|uniref:HD domain n=1 Tax=Carpediemonas membranifera TaxID=201153 RepID=A0A8J6E2P3_9EUKA|nr:HD domain [Carpediemonas membranifera]|eukprot:KAG9394928.1 HD domain [Carpediemonas membranifera]
MDTGHRFLASQQSVLKASRKKMVSDPIHELIELSPFAVNVIDTPEFQRLRDLRQLGSTCYVFPSADHTRFSHSLGVYHLAKKALEGLQSRQPELEINTRDMECVTLAGLTHDLGHGPYSHLFDQFMRRRDPKWSHERCSGLLLDRLLTENNLWDRVENTGADVKFVQTLIKGNIEDAPNEKRFLFDIVANQTNSLDVDKLDYLARDAYSLNIRQTPNTTRLLEHARVFPESSNQWSPICYHHKVAWDAFQVYHMRYSLFRQVYTHGVVKVIDTMLMDAFKAADKVMRLTEGAMDIGTYSTMTDCIVRDIERHPNPTGDAGMAKAQVILAKVRRRQLYFSVLEVTVGVKSKGSTALSQMTEAEIVDGIVKTSIADGSPVPSAIVYVTKTKLDMAMKEQNPVNHMLFWSWSQHEPFRLKGEQVSLVIPGQFQEVVVQILTSSNDQLVRDSVRSAAAKFIESCDEGSRLKPTLAQCTPKNKMVTGDSRRDMAHVNPRNLFQTKLKITTNEIKRPRLDSSVNLDEAEIEADIARSPPMTPGLDDETAMPTESASVWRPGSTRGNRVLTAAQVPSAFNTPVR